jgi:hypothetical protein
MAVSEAYAAPLSGISFELLFILVGRLLAIFRALGSGTFGVAV